MDKAAHTARAGRFGYVQIEARIAALREEAGGVAGLDRRAVLQRLCGAFQVDESLLRERGFDKAYRRIVEGV